MHFHTTQISPVHLPSYFDITCRESTCQCHPLHMIIPYVQSHQYTKASGYLANIPNGLL